MHGSSLIRLPVIDISTYREQNTTTDLTSPTILVLTSITAVSIPKLTLEACKLNVFPLKIGTAIIYMDSPFTPPQCQLFPVDKICFYCQVFKPLLELWKITTAGYIGGLFATQSIGNRVFCLVDWGRRINRLYLCRGVRSPPKNFLVMTLNNQIVIHSSLEW